MTHDCYRFTTPDGTVTHALVEAGNIDDIKHKMRLHGASKAEPVEPPACVLCDGPICPIIDFTVPHERLDGPPRNEEAR